MSSREEKTKNIQNKKKGIKVQKDKNNKNKELTKRTLTLHLDPTPTPKGQQKVPLLTPASKPQTGSDIVSVLRKVQRASALRDSWALAQRCFFYFVKRLCHSLLCHFESSLWVCSRAEIRTGSRRTGRVVDGRTGRSTNKQPLSSFFLLEKSRQQLFNLPTALFGILVRMRRTFWRVFASCVGFVKNNEQQKPPALCC